MSLREVHHQKLWSQKTDSIPMIQNGNLEKLHPNHFIIFQFKEWVIELPKPTSIVQIKQNDLLNAPRDFFSEISFMELQMRYHLDILKTVEILDRGLTINRAGHHKQLAKCRMELSGLKMAADPDSYTKVHHMKEMKIAMSELKQVSLSFKYPEIR